MTNDVKRFISADVAYTDAATPLLVGSLPAKSYITGIKVLASTAFNSSGTDLVIVGTTADDNRFADAVDVSSAGDASVTLLNVGAFESAANSTPIFVEYNQSIADASAGAAKVVIEFAQE